VRAVDLALAASDRDLPAAVRLAARDAAHDDLPPLGAWVGELHAADLYALAAIADALEEDDDELTDAAAAVLTPLAEILATAEGLPPADSDQLAVRRVSCLIAALLVEVAARDEDEDIPAVRRDEIRMAYAAEMG
jgi:hypothetical protein